MSDEWEPWQTVLTILALIGFGWVGILMGIYAICSISCNAVHKSPYGEEAR